jgi:KEOPS complex subunit Cgi121
MDRLPVVSDIRAARCSIRDTADFLRNLRAVASAHDTHIICFNADMIAGRIHAASAVARAVRALDRDIGISNNLEMESLLYAAGSRQCNIAASFGIHKGENQVFICCYPAQTGVWTALEPMFHFFRDRQDTITPRKRKTLMETFTISPEEIAAAGGDRRIVDIVLERVALLQVMR